MKPLLRFVPIHEIFRRKGKSLDKIAEIVVLFEMLNYIFAKGDLLLRSEIFMEGII